jgi:CheY-like chemotaxis protein
MPVMNGTDAMKNIRSRIEQHAQQGQQKVDSPLIVALTASVSASQIGQIIDQGFDDCLLKPLTRKDLLNCLQKIKR